MGYIQVSKQTPPRPPLCKGGSKRVAPAAQPPPLAKGGLGGSARGVSLGQSRPGKTLVMFALLLPVLLGMVGLVIDCGLLIAAQR